MCSQNEGIIVSKDEYVKRLPMYMISFSVETVKNCFKIGMTMGIFFHHILSKPDSQIIKNNKVIAYVFTEWQ